MDFSESGFVFFSQGPLLDVDDAVLVSLNFPQLILHAINAFVILAAYLVYSVLISVVYLHEVLFTSQTSKLIVWQQFIAIKRRWIGAHINAVQIKLGHKVLHEYFTRFAVIGSLAREPLDLHVLLEDLQVVEDGFVAEHDCLDVFHERATQILR